jgi:uncharacterized membrane protein
MSAQSAPRKKQGFPALIPALLLLGTFPLIFGVLRLIELAGGPSPMPAVPAFTAAPLPVIIHIAGAAFYIFLGALQFSPAIRGRWPVWHRMAGRMAVLCGLLVAGSALWMTIFYAPANGTGEMLRIFRLLIGAAMIASIGLGYVAIRRRDVTRHRQWMTRGYALGLGAATQMLVLMVAEMIIGPPGLGLKDVLMGGSWLLNLAIAEIAIRRQARAAVPRVRAQPAAG